MSRIKISPINQLSAISAEMVMTAPVDRPVLSGEQQARELLRRLISDSNVICYNDPLKREVEAFLARPSDEAKPFAGRKGVVYKNCTDLQKEFEAWAAEQGLPVGLAHYDQCEDGRFPSTYQTSGTESAWRAWFKKSNAVQFRFEPILYVSAHRLQDALAANDLTVQVHSHDAGMHNDVTLYRIATDHS
jgi:hypothetical protein